MEYVVSWWIQDAHTEDFITGEVCKISRKDNSINDNKTHTHSIFSPSS